VIKQQLFSEQLDLELLGFDSFFRNQVPEQSRSQPARVVRVAGERCDVLTADGPCQAYLPRKLRRPPPVVGDWLLVAVDHQPPQVTNRLTRKTQLARAAAGRRTRAQVIAANLDRVFVVMGLDGDFNPRRIERYLAMCADAGIEVVVFLTKALACPDVEAKLAACREVMPPGTALALHPIDVVAGLGNDLPQRYATRGTTVALVGSSGAGKSTLVNHILNSETMATGRVRSGDDRGRHTTTHRELWCTPNGGVVIDNPGIRELGLWIEGDGLQRAFAEVDSLASRCKFNNCSHRHEPGCAVLGARDRGELDADRLASYDRLQREVEATQRRQDERTRRADGRRQGKLYRSIQRERRRQRGE